MNIRWHGWGDQGINSATRILVDIAIASDYSGKAVPDKSPECRDIPHCAFSLIDDTPLKDSILIPSPDLAVVFDELLFDKVNIIQGIPENGKLLVNSSLTPLQLKEEYYLKGADVLTINAKQIMLEQTGEENLILPMIAAVSRVARIAELRSFQEYVGTIIFRDLEDAVKDKFRIAVKRSYEEIIGLWKG